MTLPEFKATLHQPSVPVLPVLLQALWHDAKGDWDSAHALAQDDLTANGAWVHAYLHRKEGDLSNARYWYSRAGRNLTHQSLEDEWEEIAAALIRNG